MLEFRIWLNFLLYFESFTSYLLCFAFLHSPVVHGKRPYVLAASWVPWWSKSLLEICRNMRLLSHSTQSTARNKCTVLRTLRYINFLSDIGAFHSCVDFLTKTSTVYITTHTLSLVLLCFVLSFLPDDFIRPPRGLRWSSTVESWVSVVRVTFNSTVNANVSSNNFSSTHPQEFVYFSLLFLFERSWQFLFPAYCANGCVNGICLAPNQCSCHPGFRGANCTSSSILWRHWKSMKLIEFYNYRNLPGKRPL